ncbi:MAG: DUF3108 domain-containing protein [Candidatus Brocadiia bacterium]
MAAGLALALAAGLAPRLCEAVEPWLRDHPLRHIRSETLVYRVQAKGATVGKATFTVSRDSSWGEEQVVLRAEAEGTLRLFVVTYRYHSVLTSRVALDGLVQRSSMDHRLLPSYKRKWLRFSSLGVDYFRHKPCECPPNLCHNPDHFRLKKGERVHRRDSEKPRHCVWGLRERHRHVRLPAYDMLAALYLARGLELTPGTKAGPIIVVAKRDVWAIEVLPREEETIEVPAGTFQCVRVGLNPIPANEHAMDSQEEDEEAGFEGPFGLKGDIAIYLDKATGRAVKVNGTKQADLKIKTLDVGVEAELVRIGE